MTYDITQSHDVISHVTIQLNTDDHLNRYPRSNPHLANLKTHYDFTA